MDALSRARGPATIHDVAARAGVGIATVSRVLRGSARVRAQTRARVLSAVDELDFRSDPLSTSSAEGRCAANGIAFPDLSGPYYAEVLLGYVEAASRLGQSVVVLATERRPDAAAAVVELAAQVDGLVLLGRTVSDEVVAQILSAGTPVLLVAREPLHGADSLRADNVGGARALASHLAGHGYAETRFLGMPDAASDAALRWATLRDSLAPAALPVVPCDFDVGSGFAAAARLIAEGQPRADAQGRPRLALVCADDEIALGAIEAVEGAGLQVGVDVAITGWDDILAARHARPDLTTVRQPMRLLGATAAEALDERIHAHRTTPRHDVLATELVVRRSCGCTR